MVKVELIDIDSSSDEETLQGVSEPTSRAVESEKQEEEINQNDGDFSNTNGLNNQTTSFNPNPDSTDNNPGKDGEDEDEKRRNYIDKLLNMHSHVCNRIASLEPHMDSVQRLKWQRQASLSVPAVKGKFLTNYNTPDSPPPVANRARVHAPPDPDWNPSTRPPWMVNTAPSTSRAPYRNSAPRRRKTYKRKRTATMTKQTARKSTAHVYKPPVRKTARKPKKPTTTKTASTTLKTSTSTGPSSSSVKREKGSTTKSTPVKKESVKREYVKSER